MNRGSHGGRDRGQSGTIGIVLVFAIVIAGATLVVAVGGAGLVDVQSESEIQRAENSMTLFDSRAAMVALGDSDIQSVSLGQDSGTVRVVEETGWINITHHNYTGKDDSHIETIYNKSLGKVVYENGDRKLAYQAGGVWRIEPEGDARMVSPPEFHYRGATLTLPVIRTFGSGSATGSVGLSIHPKEQAKIVFPNETTASVSDAGAPYDPTASTGYRNYTNAIRNGTVNITVNSEYAEGWLTYFEERTTGTTTRLGEDTVRLTLETTTGAPGDFEMPAAGDSVRAGSIAGGHPITDFSVNLDIDKNKPHFSFYAVEGNKEFEVHIYSDVNPSNACPAPSSDVFLSTYYYDGDGSNTYETWESGPLDPTSVDGLSWNCDGGELSLTVDFMDDVSMVYDQIGSDGIKNPGTDDPSCGKSTGVTRGNKYAFYDRLKSCDGSWSLRSTSTWDQHALEVGYESTTYTQGSSQTLDEVMNHYLGALDSEVDLIAKDGPGNSDAINEPGSAGRLLYSTKAGSQYVTFLHITENEIEVDVN